MDVVIYESSSTGGCYNYSKHLFSHYQKSDKFGKTSLIIPKGCDSEVGHKILLKDFAGKKKYFPRLYFILRNLLNPLILFFYLLGKRKSLVILNDFEQYSFFLWVPVFYLLKWKHKIALFLHDPDRDEYMPTIFLSKISMGWITGLSDFLLYHEYLPEKSYYSDSRKFLSVPHGIYELKGNSKSMEEELRKSSQHRKMITVIGNIRSNKNYEMAIQSLKELEELNLLIAGSRANSSVDVEALKQLAADLGVADRVIWIERYLRDDELASIISFSEIILMIYTRSFVSHSGVINMIAPFQPKIVIAEHPSGLNSLVRRFGLGKIVKEDDVTDLTTAILELMNEDANTNGWNQYIDYSSWENQINIVAERVLKKD